MTAKEMFEELGYEQNEELYELQYIKNFDEAKHVIAFDYAGESVICYYEIPYYQTKHAFYVPVDDLKAINKQIKELGWNNE